MKLFLVMCLAVFAINAEPINTSSGKYFGANNVMEKIQKWIDEFIEEANKAKTEMLANYHKTITKVTGQINELFEKAKDKFDENFKIIDGILEEMAAKNEAANDCVEKYQPEFKEIINNAKNSLERCKVIAFNYLNRNIDYTENEIVALMDYILEEIVDEIKVFKDCEKRHFKAIINNALRTQIDDSCKPLKECYQNSPDPDSTYHCIIKHLMDGNEDIISSTKGGVEHMGKEATDIISIPTNCISKTTAKVNSEITELIKNIEKCIESNNSQQK